MNEMNLLHIEPFKSTNFRMFQRKFSLPIEEQSKEELNRCLQVFYASVRKKMEANSKFLRCERYAVPL